MSDEPRLKVVLCWHMHQPDYRNPITGVYQLPWTYLHGIKDYVDMAAHLESIPAARAVVNFAPTLLEQIADYASQIDDYLHARGNIRDPFLASLDNPALPPGEVDRLQIIRNCLKLNRERLVVRYSAFQRLTEMADWVLENPDQVAYVDEQFFVDLIVWYHLAWLGETVRRESELAQCMINKINKVGVSCMNR